MVNNLTNLTNSENIQGLFSFANQVTDGLFVGIIMIAIAFIMFIALKGKMETTSALTVTFFLCTIFGIFLRVVGLLNLTFVFLFAVGTAFGVLYLYMTSN